MQICRIIFMGTPDFAVPALSRLSADGHEIVMAVTRPDRPRGRGMEVTPSPVKVFALENGIRVYQPESLKDTETQRIITVENADCIVVAAYGQLLPPALLDAPRLGCINIHASLLPRFRGAAPINRAVMAGDALGGVTVMRMEKGLDTGGIILQKETAIPPDMTAGEYHDALSLLGAEAISEFFGRENHTQRPQDESLATYAAKIEKSETETDFSGDCINVYNKIRGLSPYPCAFAVTGGRRLKLIMARPGCGNGRPGEVLRADNAGIEIACGSGSVVITLLQPEGKRVMSAGEYLAGNKI